MADRRELLLVFVLFTRLSERSTIYGFYHITRKITALLRKLKIIEKNCHKSKMRGVFHLTRGKLLS
jgi:hypothetical protein